MQFIRFAGDENLFLVKQEGDTKLICFYGEMLFQLLKLTKNQDKFLFQIQSYLKSNEVVIYENLKKELPKKYVNSRVYSSALILFIMKKAEKLCTKIIMIKKKLRIEDNDMEQFSHKAA